MAIVGDRVKETATTTGTGDFTCGGAVQGFQSVNDGIGQNIFFTYCIAHQSANEFEAGIGYLSGSTTLVRYQPTTSSNGNALVSFSAGTKDVICSIIKQQYQSKGMQAARAAFLCNQ